MTDWIEHTTDACPVDPETVVEVLLPGYTRPSLPCLATKVNWNKGAVAYYSIITPAKPLKPTGVLRREITEDPADWKRASYAENAKPPEPEEDEAYLEEAQRQADREYAAYKRGFEAGRTQPEPDFVNLRLECLKLAVKAIETGDCPYSPQSLANRFLRYAIDGYAFDGSVDKA
jgi:hypothetical protein